jgi:uncharacterized protein YdaU (DUF1376 family)
MGRAGDILNYYNHHIGDYTRDTAHLSIMEDGVYRRLIDIYYSTERPLPLEPRAIHRLVRAVSRQERAAVDVILAEFFTQSADGWRQKRCDIELARAREEGEESQARKDNERERQRRHRERRKQLFEELREHGVVPRWDTPLDDLERELVTHKSRNQERDENAPVTPPVTRTATANQYPIANNQEPKGLTPLAPSDFSLEAGGPANGTPKNGKPKPFAEGEIVIEIPLVGGTEYPVRQSLVTELDAAYPAVDVLQTLREIRAWNLANPRERKTESGVVRHINRWMAKEQNRG